jgi:putative transposase
MPDPLTKKKHYDVPGHAHALTFTCYRRRHLFRDEMACEYFLDELINARLKHNLKIWAYVVMPNHGHVLLWPKHPQYDISNIQREFKSLTAARYIAHIREKEPNRLGELLVKDTRTWEVRFWQRGGGFDRNVWKALAIQDEIKYIEGNPVRAGLAKHPEDWKWSSAHARVHKKGLVPDTFQIPHLMK